MILTTIDQFRAVVPTVAKETEFSELKPYSNSAELWLKNNILGATLYAYVDALGATPAGTDIDLQQLCLNIIGNHAFWDAAPFLDVVLTNAGFGVVNSNNKAPASKERIERLREQCLVRRDNEVENLILFLEQNATYHDNWKGSPVYSVLTDCLVRTADEMKNYSSWTGTRKDFLLLKPRLIHITKSKLEPVFSKNLIEELIESQRDGDLTADEMTLVDMLKHTIGCTIDENKNIAAALAADALRFIDENIASFPLYTASKEYLARTSEGYINEEDSPIFLSLM
jgi:hypothetical protein